MNPVGFRRSVKTYFVRVKIDWKPLVQIDTSRNADCNEHMEHYGVLSKPDPGTGLGAAHVAGLSLQAAGFERPSWAALTAGLPPPGVAAFAVFV